MNETTWYYKLFSEEFGPVTTARIAQLLTVGTPGPDDPVRAGGQDDWGTAAQVWQSVTDDAPSDLTDLSELNLVFEENETTPAAESPDVDSFSVHSDAETDPHQQGTVRAPVSDDEEAVYYVEILAQIFGPMPVSYLVKMAESGALISDEKIRCGDDGEWSFPEVIPDIAVAIGAAASRPTETSSAMTDPRPGSSQSQGSSIRPTATAASAPQVATTEGSAATSAKVTSAAAPTGDTPTKGTSPRETAPARKKRKRRTTQQDEFLQEIFSELFTENGEVRDVADRPKRSAAANPAHTSRAADPPSDNTTGSESSVASCVADAASLPAAAVPTSPPKSRPPVSPSPSLEKSGGGLSLPEPKVPGIIGGVAIVYLLLGALFTGIISLPGSSMDVAGKLQPLGLDDVELLGEANSEEKWKDYGSRVRAVTRTVVEHLKAKGILSEQEKHFLEVAVKYVELVNCKADDKEGQKVIFEEISVLMQ